ncbi:MAG: hypothetical protein E7161_02745 [Firmicutes bacterium]|nr:hypothetical protein [Bacillota bacterium]
MSVDVDILDIKNSSREQQIVFFENNTEFIDMASREILDDLFDRKYKLPITVNQFLSLALNRKKFNYDNVNKYLATKELLDLFDSFPIAFFYYFYAKNPLFGARQINIIKLKAEDIQNEQKKMEFLELCNKLKLLIVPRMEHYGAYYDAKGYQIAKLLFNDKVIANNEISLLHSYLKTFDRNILVEILCNAFGEHIKQIFAKRPELDLYHLININCFDKVWVENFGIGFVHYLLNYNFDYLNKILGDLTKKPHKLQNFKKLYQLMVQTHSLEDATVLHDTLEVYYEHEVFFDNLDFDKLTGQQKENLSLLINDNPILWFYIKSQEDLENYMDIRKNFYIKYANEFAVDVNLFIQRYLTGIFPKYGSKTVNKLNFDYLIKVYNIENIVKDGSVADDIGLSEDEKALLLLFYKLKSCDYSPSVYIEILNIILSYEHLNPKTFKKVFDKIKNYYTQAFKGQLSGSKDLDKLKKYEIDGITVVEYNGEPFNHLCSVNTLDIGIHVKNSPPLFGKNLLYSWLHREEEASTTISTTIYASDIDFVPSALCKGHIKFIFDNNVDIIAYGGSDIAAGHRPREPYHCFDFSLDTDLQFSSIVECKKTC